MPEFQRPFVAVIGGFFALDDDNAQAGQSARRDAEGIGAELARAGFGLVVYFSKDKCLELHVVKGFAAEIPKGSAKHCIRIQCAHSQRVTGGAVSGAPETVYFPEEKDRDDLFDGSGIGGDDWVAPFYRSLADEDGSGRRGVDAVLIMAGGQSTSIAGQITVGRQLPVLAIDAYPGAAKDIWKELKTRSHEYPDYSQRGAKQCVGWLREACEVHLARKRERREGERTLADLSSDAKQMKWALIPSLSMIAALVWGVGGGLGRDGYAFLMMFALLFAGGTGALIGSLLWARAGKGTAPSTALLLGALAGMLAGLAYVVPQWISNVDAETAHSATKGSGAATVTLADKIQFVSAILVAFTAGIGFDTVFTRYKALAADLRLDVTPRGASNK